MCMDAINVVAHGGLITLVPTMRPIPGAVKHQARIIHEAIHNPIATSVTVDDQTYPIITAKNGCRMVAFGDYTVMEQNKLKTTPYGQRARAGERLTWIIPKSSDESWELVTD